MQILLIEPYYGGSYQAWADGYQRHSEHDVRLLTLPAQFWKWRMQGGAMTLARMFKEGNYAPDLILATDMMNVATFRALAMPSCPIALYFHENQLSYPQNSRQKHGWQYGFVNLISALASDAVYFSSEYHYEIFFNTLPKMLKHFADYNELEAIDALRAKAQVLPLALDLRRLDSHEVTSGYDDAPLLVWNHRWDEDKNLAGFVEAVLQLHRWDVDFRLALLGHNPRKGGAGFDDLPECLGDKLVQFGYVEDLASYARWLWQADYIVSSAFQEFFGIALAEGIYCGTVPIVPNRLNYPYLIPQALRERCLYRHDGELAGFLRAHLQGKIP